MRQFEDALNILHTTERPNVIRVAVLDGVVWIKSERKMHKILINEEDIVLSSLLISDFLNSLS